jgi:type IV secretory pathway TrbL component
MGGNVTEWGEPISFHLFPGNGAVQRGANWLDDASAMLSTAFDETATTSDLNFAVGFRVVMLISAVPEPQLAAFVVVISVGTAWLLRRSQIHRRRTIQGLRNSQYM